MIAFDKGYIEIYDYPRGERAVITYTETGEQEVIEEGEMAFALAYEVADMEKAVTGDTSRVHLDYTRDVMQLMTQLRRDWGMTYPEEE